MNTSETLEQVKKWCLGIKTLDEAEAGIRRDGMLKQGLHTWSKRLGGLTIGLGVFCLLGAAGILLAPTLIAGGLYLATKGATYLLDRDIDNKVAAAHDLAAKEHEGTSAPAASKPQPKLGAKVTSTFTKAATTQPAANDTAKPASKASSLLKRFGLGG
jgi:hypothetical protein